VKPTRTWILITDGGGARILEALGDGRDLHEISGSGTPRSNPLNDLASPPDGAARPSTVRANKALEALFASQLTALLTNYLRNDAFDRLVIVAPPSMLGELRKMIGPKVREKITAEIDRDLTKIPNSEISRYLDDVVAL
jgi:release factor family 12